jgi:peptidoglycan/xylan/chitin deacetylase (PgdA/CDA1 family)
MQYETSSDHGAAKNDATRAEFMKLAEAKELCRKVVSQGLYRTGLLRTVDRLSRSRELSPVEGSRLPRLRRSAGSKFGILCYHRVGTDGVPIFSRLQPKRFRAQMEHIRGNYRVVPLGQLCREMQDETSAEPTLAITFDDGYRDLYTHAFSVLQEYQLPATIYLIGRSVESGEVPWYDRIFLALEAASGTSFEVEMDGIRKFAVSSPTSRTEAAWEIVSYLRTKPDAWRQKWCASFEKQVSIGPEEAEGCMLNWDQVRTMHQAGVSFGAHTMSHPSVSRLDSESLEGELGESKRLLERGLGAPIEDFAYPFGKPEDRSQEAENFLARSGYRSAVTTTEGFNISGTNRFQLRRLSISDDWSLVDFAFNVSRMFLETPAEMGPMPVKSAESGLSRVEQRELQR